MHHFDEIFETGLAESVGRQNMTKTAFIILVLCVAFVSSDFDWYTSTYPHFTVSAEVDEVRMIEGNTARRLAMAVIGLLGAMLLFLWPGPCAGTFRNWTLNLLGVYIAFCFASLWWSDAPLLTAKRLIILMLCIFGILGVVRHLSASDLMYMALGICLTVLVVGLIAEISLGSLRPFAGDYRFAGTLHPNGQGAACAIVSIAALCISKEAGKARGGYLILFAIAFILLLLTKSRSSLIGCSFALYATAFLMGSSGLRKFLAIGPPFIICAALLTVSLLGFDVWGEVNQAMHMGRDMETSELGSLNGRIPLWALLFEYIMQQPLLGYGYQSFWTAERMMDISYELQWTIPNGHSLLIDILLQVGLLGAICFGLGILSGVGCLIRRCFISGTPALFFALAMAIYALVNSLLESSYTDPSTFECFIAFCTLVHAQKQPGITA